MDPVNIPDEIQAEIHAEADLDSHPKPPLQRTLIAALCLLLVFLLMAFIPPLINVSRLQRRIALNIGASLGRPVHFDRVSLSLLPLPGFTLERFVVDEDPAFGSEPILRADIVQANVRISSLWSSHVEFSKISLTDPSVNLVHTANGQWNLQSILIEASRIQAAPTAQRHAGPSPRFPYIEATGARLNLKLDQEKTPYSLTDADFSLWLPEPRQWHFRLEAHPTRTVSTPADTGTVRVEGTLGNANTPAASLEDLPMDIHGDWQDAQLGGLGYLLLGRDAPMRGDLTLNFSILGNLSHAAVTTHIKLARVRRADFVPAHPLSLEAACQANASDAFRTFSHIECHWPPADYSDRSTLILTAEIPDIRHLAYSSAGITLPALPAATLLDWLRVATPRAPTGLSGTGTLAGTLAWHPSPAIPGPAWSGEMDFSGESLQAIGLGPNPIPLGDILLRPAASSTATPPHARSPAPPTKTAQPANTFDLLPIALPLGGKQPATLDAHFDASGYTLHLTGNAIQSHLLALADAIPQFGEGLRQLLEPTQTSSDSKAAPASTAIDQPPNAIDSDSAAPTHFDLTATRTWGGPQVWRQAQTIPASPHHHPTQ